MEISNLKKLSNYKNIFYILLSLLSTYSLYKYGLVSSKIMCLIMFGLIISLYLKQDNIKDKRGIMLITLFFSLMYTWGHILFDIRFSIDVNFWREIIRIRNIMCLIGNTSLMYLLISNLTNMYDNLKCINKEKVFKNKYIKNILIILLCWLPYYIIYFPGILTGDSVHQMHMISGIVNLTNHHPIISTIVIGIPYKIMYFITHNPIISTGFSTFIQMCIMASIYSYAIEFLRKRNVNNKILILVLLYFSLFPLNAIYSITLWKDIIYSGLLLLLALELYRVVENKDKLNIKFLIPFIIISILTCLYRGNAIYMYFILIISTLLIFKKYRVLFVKVFAIILVTYYGITGPVFNLLKIDKPSAAEYLAIPLQQIGRMAYKEVKFNKNETEILNNLIGIEELKNSYNVEIVDTIKFNKNYNSKYYDKNKVKFMTMWAGLCIKHFDIATEAYLLQTLGYWYPETDYWITTAKIDDNKVGIKSVFPQSIRDKVSKLLSRSIPIFGVAYCIGLYFWLTILALYYGIRNKKYMLMYVAIPILGNWFTMMIAAPVFSELRYVYSEFIFIPILLILPKLLNIKK